MKNILHSRRGLCLAFWLLLVAPLNLPAQFDTAAVLGTVRDGKGGTIANAKITVRNTATGITNQTTTDAEGDYVFPAVKIGTYEVRGEAPGFSAAVAANVNVTVNARQRVDLTLQVGQVTEVVNVVETTPLLETDSSSKGQVIGQRQIVNLPIRGRTYSSLALLAPGVRESQSGNSGDITTRREGSYNVNGLRSVYNNFLLDGVDNNFYGTTNQGYSNQAAQPSPGFRSGISHVRERVLGRVWPNRRGRDERVHTVRFKRVSRNAVELFPEHFAECHRVFQARRKSQAADQSQPIRIRFRRPYYSRSDLLLCGL